MPRLRTDGYRKHASIPVTSNRPFSSRKRGARFWGPPGFLFNEWLPWLQRSLDVMPATLFIVEVKNELNYSFTSPYAFMVRTETALLLPDITRLMKVKRMAWTERQHT